MVFSDTTTKLGLIQDCEQLVFSNYGDISSNADRLYDFTARLNRAYDKVATLIMSVDGRWQWDDTNYTDFPIGKTNLVNGQQDYAFDVEHLLIQKVVVLDTNSNKTIIYPFDIQDPNSTDFLENPSTYTGIPTNYDKLANSLFLYPIPNYNKTDGLIVYYQRKPSYFTYTDTTKSPGIPSTLHRLLSLEASLDYAISKRLDIRKDLAVQVQEMENLLREFYQKRQKDEVLQVRTVERNTK